MISLLLATVIEFQVVRLKEPGVPTKTQVLTTFVGVQEAYKSTSISPVVYRFIQVRGLYKRYNTIVPKMYYARYLAERDRVLRAYPTKRPVLIVSSKSNDGYMYGFASRNERVALVAGSVVNGGGLDRRGHLVTLYAHEIAHLFGAAHTALGSCDVMDPNALVCANQPLKFSNRSIRAIHR